MGQPVADGQPDVGAAGEGVGVGRSFTGQIGKKEQPFTADGQVCGRGQQVVELHAGRQRIAVPAQAACGREHHPHQMPFVRQGVGEGMQASLRFVERLVCGGEDDAGGAQGQGDDALLDRAHAHGLG